MSRRTSARRPTHSREQPRTTTTTIPNHYPNDANNIRLMDYSILQSSNNSSSRPTSRVSPEQYQPVRMPPAQPITTTAAYNDAGQHSHHDPGSVSQQLDDRYGGEYNEPQYIVNHGRQQRHGISRPHRVPTASPSSSSSAASRQDHDAWPVGTRSNLVLDDDDEEGASPDYKDFLARFHAAHQQLPFPTRPPMTVVGRVSDSAILHSVAEPQDVVVMVEEEQQQPDHGRRRRTSPQQQQLNQGNPQFAATTTASPGSSRSRSQPQAQTPSRPEQQRSRQPEQQQHDHNSSSSLHSSFGRLSMTSNSNVDNTSNNQGTVDSAVRRAQETMLSFTREYAAAHHLKPEERAPPRPVRPREEMLLKLKTSRRCLERVRQEAVDLCTNRQQQRSHLMMRRHPPEPHRNANMTFVLGLSHMYQEQGDLVATAPKRFMAVGCTVCQDELIVPKSAVMVECPRCHHIGAAAAIPYHNQRNHQMN